MKKINKNTLLKILKYAKKQRLLILLTLILSLICVICDLYIPVLAGRALDTIIGVNNVDFSVLKKHIFEILIYAVISAILQWVVNTISNSITFRMVREIRNEAVKKLSCLPLSYVDSHTSGEIISRIISDADNFADGLLMGFSRFFTGIATIICTLIFMLKINAVITPVVILLTPLSLFIASFIAKRTHSMFLKQSEERGNQTALIDEAVNNHNVIVSNSMKKYVTERFDAINDEYAKSSLKAIFFSSITNPSTRFVNNIIYACVALAGALYVINNPALFTVGELSCFLNYSGQYAKPFNEISGIIAELQNAIACAERVFELIEAEPEKTDKKYSVDRKNLDNSFKFENVDFSYSKSKKLIEDLSFDVKKGDKIAIVGPTGCGKTTVINLLMRFYDVDSGKITIDDVDIRDITRHSLRSGYGMVLQETWLKTATVAENIALGRPDATREEIIAAAKSAYAHSFIKKLPNGYDTMISSTSSSLSEGQKQLLCIARIMLTLPPVLILDEATSSIDANTELNIRKAFMKMMENRTSFVVAHRLTTIRNSDLILVMKDGKIIEKGNHRELMSNHGFYEKLYNSRIL